MFRIVETNSFPLLIRARSTYTELSTTPAIALCTMHNKAIILQIFDTLLFILNNFLITPWYSMEKIEEKKNFVKKKQTAVTTIRSVDWITNEWCCRLRKLFILYYCSQTATDHNIISHILWIAYALVTNLFAVALPNWILLFFFLLLDILSSLNRCKWNEIPICFKLHFWLCYRIDRVFGPYFIDHMHCFGCARKEKEKWNKHDHRIKYREPVTWIWWLFLVIA